MDISTSSNVRPLCNMFDFHFYTQLLKLFEVPVYFSVFVSLLQVHGSKFLIGLLVFEDEVGGNQDLASYGYQSSFFASSSYQTLIFTSQIRVFGSRCRPGALDKQDLQVFIAMGYSCAFFLPADSLLPGDMPAQEVKCCSSGNCSILSPISARM